MTEHAYAPDQVRCCMSCGRDEADCKGTKPVPNGHRPVVQLRPPDELPPPPDEPPPDDEPPPRKRRQRKTPQGDTNISGTPPEKPPPDVPAMTMAQVEAVYARWLHDGDSVTTRVCHAVYVANMALSGDPVWVFLVGGSGQGKTERLAPLSGLPHVELVSTLSGEAALLSATARKDRAEHAHGGLLKRIGDKGVLIIKDFTSILEMDRTARGQVLAALREVYDGRWDREVGAEGGQTLTWRGKCGVLAASTTSIDRAHAVMNDMGPRSLFVRLAPADPARIGGSALDHMGRETAMRDELAAATAGLLTHLPGKPHDIAPVRTGLIGLAALVALARSPVHRDWSGEVELVGDPEAPTRIIKQLGQLWRACGVLGLGRAGIVASRHPVRARLDSQAPRRGHPLPGRPGNRPSGQREACQHDRYPHRVVPPQKDRSARPGRPRRTPRG